MRPWLPPLWSWAARDILRRPFESLLSTLIIASTITVIATGLLLGQGLRSTVAGLAEEWPSLVVRRIGPGGWAPIPLSAQESLKKVRGVTRAQARTWGVVRWQDQPLTLMASAEDLPAPLSLDDKIKGLASGQAIVGSAISLPMGHSLVLHGPGGVSRTFTIAARLPARLGLVGHDVVFVVPADARHLLGLAPDVASDVALWVFHDKEMEAIRPDLEKTLSFPVKVTTRDESLGAYLARVERAVGLRTGVILPALLALALLALATVRTQLGSRRDTALLRALGWGNAKIVQLNLFRALVVAMPAAALGWASAYSLVFVSGPGWAAHLLFGWTGLPPRLSLSPEGALITLVEVGALVVAPWIAAMILPTLASANSDPEQWLRAELD